MSGLQDLQGAVDKTLYKEDGGVFFPSATWIAKVVNSGDSGYWIMDNEGIASYGKPEPFWKLENMVMGGPAGEEQQIWRTTHLRCVPIGVRKSKVLTVKSFAREKKIRMSPYVKRDDYEAEYGAGDIKMHYQVAVMIPGLSYPVVLGLPGLTKTASWSNDPKSGYSAQGFGLGVEERIKEYGEKRSKEVGFSIPPLCTWEIDLVPQFIEQKGKMVPYLIEFHGTTFVNPFTVELRTRDEGGEDEDWLPEDRFVGIERFREYQQLRADLIMDWEKEWGSDMEAQVDSNDEEDEEPVLTYDDDIPF